MGKGEIPHKRYLLDRDTYIKYRALMKTLNNSLAMESSDVAQFRLHVIDFSNKHGVKATLDAFNVKRSTFFDWKRRYKDSGGKPVSLIPTSTKPKHIRIMETDSRLVEFIKQMRQEYGNVGKHIIKPFVDEYAEKLEVSTIGTTTIAKIIRRRNFTFERRIRAKRKTRYRKLQTRKSPKVKQPGYIEIDTIHVTINKQRLYFVSIIDIYTRFAFVRLVPSPSSKQATLVTKQFQTHYHLPLHTIQTDNGSEFLGSFHQHTQDNNLKHIFIYPNSPRLNGVVERFNRTIQEEFINRSDEIYYNHTKFNYKLKTYLHWYNTKRPHSSLDYQSPIQFINTMSPKCM